MVIGLESEAWVDGSCDLVTLRGVGGIGGKSEGRLVVLVGAGVTPGRDGPLIFVVLVGPDAGGLSPESVRGAC